MSLPTNISVSRVQNDDYPEVFSVTPMSAGTSAVLRVEGFSNISAVVDETAKTLTFPVSSEVADATVGSYDYDIVQTVGGRTRTLVEGKWTIKARRVP